MNLRNFYGILAFASTVAAVQSMIFPRWPEAYKISTKELDQLSVNVSSNGHIVKPLATTASYSDFNISHTALTSLRIDSNSDLVFLNVQVRDRKDLDVLHITKTIKSLQLTKSATESKQPPYFFSDIQPSGTTYQTCLVQGNLWPLGLAVKQDQLTAAVDQVKSSEAYLPIKRFLGFSPSRHYQCMLITLKTTLPIKESNQLWSDLLRQFENTFNSKK
jgi:hypothetical protein